MEHVKDQPKKAKKNKARRKRYIIATISIIMAVIFSVAGAAFIYAGNLLGSINYQPVQNDDNGTNQTQTTPNKPIANKKEFDDPEIIDGLYHDDAVINVLIIGTDGFYGAGERSDSMMLLSIDRRHKKLKLTSLMRDMYLPLTDGWADNRLNAAFALGGASCLISTIETNFHVDIDRYVMIDYDALNDIIDTLGGIEIELSAGEAEQINIHSGETSQYATEGMNTLTGLQARFYMRIRNVEGDDGYGDFSRTSRQRKVFSIILNKFKSSNVLTITQLAGEILPKITTDFSQSELTTMISNALTYMNYEFSQLRLPGDGMYYDDWVVISGYDASVLIPDLELNSAKLNDYIYEDSFPENAKTLEDAGF